MVLNPLCAPPLNSLQVTGLQDRCTAVWHHEPPAVSPSVTGFERTVAEQHLANFELWHAEDMARAPEVTIKNWPASSDSSTALTSAATISPSSATCFC